ncbi:cation-translocating P-type ATPase [Caproiciproducens sp. MSJ-32]|uniref:cation-translocating P-type ATPase n=1 Tax=Caproiciproducens sp. MSJ-32 TaxID=2841527 RepID=UPI001C101D4F|nr:cation-translocating P-type ATPase [Caproiciproducens sp. MSJ-32]MBU5455352.1 cation-translocating P-type ATPase [Caproiciproducens sp. MSJ-32]
MWFNEEAKVIEERLSTNILNGLSKEEAEKRLAENGPNKLKGKKKKSMLMLLFEQINDPMIYILLVAAIISAIVGEVSDALIIILVIIINALIGVVQESKAEKALEALKNLSTPKAVVKRDGEIYEIESSKLVVGDIVIIDAGRYIPADIRLVETANLKIEESAFTGESLPVEKHANIINEGDNLQVAEQANMAFMSTLSTYGRGIGIVVATGMDTQIGKIAKMLDAEEDNTTPLQKKLAKLGKTLGFLAVGISILMFIVSMFQGRDFLTMFMTSISLAVAAIPEGLPAIVAIVLALGVQRMAKQNAIIRKLPSVETLGSVNIICSDKTGTLTINKMTVKKYFVNNKIENLEEIDKENPESKLLIEGMVLCSDATSKDGIQTGDPTEIALIDVGNKVGIFKDDLLKKHKRVNEIPFDSDRKLMTTVNKYNDKFYVFTKGAIDNVLKISNKIIINGQIKELSKEEKNNILKASDSLSDEALRIIALGYKIIDNENITINSLENDLIFLGFMGMIDPPREEVKASIEISKKAGIRTVMITGDHKNTAIAIAKELGIADDISQAMSGSEIDTYSDEEFTKVVNNFRVFARVSPEHKVKIVKAFKAHGNIVSMTGDGVNDAPSLQAADIGVAMGITGTDVAKGAADMILTDDNFTTIVNAVEEGRNIFTNIKKSILFLLSCNLGEIVALFVAILFNLDTPLLPIHILWVNLITDSFPALSLGVDPGDKGVMNKTPRNPNESLFAGRAGLMVIINGILIGATTLFAFIFSEGLYPESLRHAQTMAFVVLSVSQLFYSLSMRNETKSIFKIGILKNTWLIASIVFGIVLQYSIITIPITAKVFKVYSLAIKDWLIVILISLIPLVFNEILKIFFRISEEKTIRRKN